MKKQILAIAWLLIAIHTPAAQLTRDEAGAILTRIATTEDLGINSWIYNVRSSYQNGWNMLPVEAVQAVMYGVRLSAVDEAMKQAPYYPSMDQLTIFLRGYYLGGCKNGVLGIISRVAPGQVTAVLTAPSMAIPGPNMGAPGMGGDISTGGGASNQPSTRWPTYAVVILTIILTTSVVGAFCIFGGLLNMITKPFKRNPSPPSPST